MLDYLKLWTWFKKNPDQQASIEATVAEQPPQSTDDVELQKEIERRKVFAAIDDGQDRTTECFDYHKGIFSTWMGDVIENYKLFCGKGLKPMRTADLEIAQTNFANFLSEISQELDSRN
jgi:hypothetical protein